MRFTWGAWGRGAQLGRRRGRALELGRRRGRGAPASRRRPSSPATARAGAGSGTTPGPARGRARRRRQSGCRRCGGCAGDAATRVWAWEGAAPAAGAPRAAVRARAAAEPTGTAKSAARANSGQDSARRGAEVVGARRARAARTWRKTCSKITRCAADGDQRTPVLSDISACQRRERGLSKAAHKNRSNAEVDARAKRSCD